MVKVPLVVSTAPERIWLQVADDSYSATEAFPDDHSEITWCQDSVIATEVKYIRADLHDALAERCERLEADARRYRYLRDEAHKPKVMSPAVIMATPDFPVDDHRTDGFSFGDSLDLVVDRFISSVNEESP